MELWIRSQDREVLTKVVDIYKDADTNEIWSKSSFGIKNCLGIYATKERALEVLDEIQNFISIQSRINGTYEEIDIQIKSKVVEMMSRIYIMPEE